jgi:DNA repair protein RecO (recombination protein O)
MKWQEDGVILSVRSHGERSAIVSLLTRAYGRHGGLARLSSRDRSSLQPGNLVQASWSARLPEHLGTFQVELIYAPAARFLSDSLRLAAMGSLLTMLDRLLAERHPYPFLYEGTVDLLTQLMENTHWLTTYALFEIKLLENLGYGLDLSKCVVTGQGEDLAYVSPKSGGAVSRQAGLPYASRLVELPQFTLYPPPLTEILKSLNMSGYFLAKHFFKGQLPDHRCRFFQMLAQVLSQGETSQ